MPSRKNNDQFVDAVKPALESLLSDLQKTTEVLRRHNKKGGDEKWESTSSQFSYQKRASGGYDDSEPIYQEQSFSSKVGGGHDDNSRYSSHSDVRGHSIGVGGGRESKLDSMLSSVQSDMEKNGFQTIPRGDCASCGKAIIGQVVIALGKMWHPEHYVCCHCGDEIGHKNFFEKNGKAYCENDYHDLFSPRCEYCNGPIKDRCVSALGKTFHAEHFVCAQCGKPFDGEGFHERDGHAYCKEDYFQNYAPKCKGCNRAITHKYITALDTHWHPECFVCDECGSGFGGGSFFDEDGRPLCEFHYHARRGSLCAHCQQPIAGRCVTAMSRKFHPEHFCCAYCCKQLSSGTFKEARGRAFCHKCYQKIQ